MEHNAGWQKPHEETLNLSCTLRHAFHALRSCWRGRTESSSDVLSNDRWGRMKRNSSFSAQHCSGEER